MYELPLSVMTSLREEHSEALACLSSGSMICDPSANKIVRFCFAEDAVQESTQLIESTAPICGTLCGEVDRRTQNMVGADSAVPSTTDFCSGLSRSFSLFINEESTKRAGSVVVDQENWVFNRQERFAVPLKGASDIPVDPEDLADAFFELFTYSDDFGPACDKGCAFVPELPQWSDEVRGLLSHTCESPSPVNLFRIHFDPCVPFTIASTNTTTFNLCGKESHALLAACAFSKMLLFPDEQMEFLNYQQIIPNHMNTLCRPPSFPPIRIPLLSTVINGLLPKIVTQKVPITPSKPKLSEPQQTQQPQQTHLKKKKNWFRRLFACF